MNNATKPLFILIMNTGDGSFSNCFVLDPFALKLLGEAYEQGLMDSEGTAGVDTDGFHYNTINVPKDFTEKELGVSIYTLEEVIQNIRESCPEKFEKFFMEVNKDWSEK